MLKNYYCNISFEGILSLELIFLEFINIYIFDIKKLNRNLLDKGREY